MSPTTRDAMPFCPRCGCGDFPTHGQHARRCASCGYIRYFNPIVAVGVIGRDAAGRVLLIRRAKEPGKDKLGVPGGFIDAGETAEQAAAREFHEELGIACGALQYVCSSPNDYLFQGHRQPVVDLFFTTRVETMPTAFCINEVSSLELVAPADILWHDIAFPSIRQALHCALACK